MSGGAAALWEAYIKPLAINTLQHVKASHSSLGCLAGLETGDTAISELDLDYGKRYPVRRTVWVCTVVLLSCWPHGCVGACNAWVHMLPHPAPLESSRCSAVRASGPAGQHLIPCMLAPTPV